MQILYYIAHQFLWESSRKPGCCHITIWGLAASRIRARVQAGFYCLGKSVLMRTSWGFNAALCHDTYDTCNHWLCLFRVEAFEGPTCSGAPCTNLQVLKKRWSFLPNSLTPLSLDFSFSKLNVPFLWDNGELKVMSAHAGCFRWLCVAKALAQSVSEALQKLQSSKSFEWRWRFGSTSQSRAQSSLLVRATHASVMLSHFSWLQVYDDVLAEFVVVLRRWSFVQV